PENTKDISALIIDARQRLPESVSDDVFAYNIYEDEVFVKNENRRSIRRLAIDSGILAEAEVQHRTRR
ncbi:MAG: hypothetical protein IJD14_02280, partial [Christensenellaceae bacterium]|nr:hypothetical protein [Christensenellaceae bacterium]